MVITPTEKKNGTRFLQKIRKYLCILFNDVKAPRRALGYFTIITKFSKGVFLIISKIDFIIALMIHLNLDIFIRNLMLFIFSH